MKPPIVAAYPNEVLGAWCWVPGAAEAALLTVGAAIFS
jgi:hypothetical protein